MKQRLALFTVLFLTGMAAFAQTHQVRGSIKNPGGEPSRENELVVTASQVDLNFIAQERGRELTGEHWRWYDLKRMGLLTKTYLQNTNQAASVNFVDNKHIIRPIPQSTLDAITNAEEFGTNGY